MQPVAGFSRRTAFPTWAWACSCIAAVASIGVWVISPRFSITSPSLIDDWDAIQSAGQTMHELVRLSYHIRDRFQPAWTFWNWAQWRLPGAPASLVGPDLAGIARLTLLVAGLTSITWLAVQRRLTDPIERSVVSVLPALIVVTDPAFAEDLARFGPQEPALIGGTTLGVALLWGGGRRLATPTRQSVVPRVGLTALGFVAWCYGVLQKETSVTTLLLIIPALVPAWRAAQLLDRRARVVWSVLVALALAPVLLMLGGVVTIVDRGTLVYGAHVHGIAGSISLFLQALRNMHDATHSLTGYALLAIVVAAILVLTLLRRYDWILVASLIVGCAVLELSVQSQIYASRYYMPAIALFALGSARGYSFLPAYRLRLGLLIASTLLILSSVGAAHGEVSDWARGELAGDDLLSATRRATNDGCRLRVAGIDYERTRSIQFLVQHPAGPHDCANVSRYAVIGPSTHSTAEEVCGSLKATPIGAWKIGKEAEPVQLIRCDGTSE